VLSSQEQMEIIKGALAEGYKGPIFKLIEQANFKKQEEAAQQEQPEQRKTGGLKDDFKKKPLENPTPISSKTQSSVDNIMSTYFGHLDSTKRDQIANAIFLDNNSIDRTRKLIESGNLESISKSIGTNPLATRYFKGEDLGLLEKVKLGNQMKPVFKNISDSTGLSGKRLIDDVFQDTKDLQKEGFIPRNKDLNDTTAFKVAGTLNNPDWATNVAAKTAGVNLSEFSEYTPSRRETGGLVQSYESKPPSLEMLPTGNKVGKYDTLENAGIYKSGGFKKYHKGGPAHTHTDPPKKKLKTGVNSFVKGTPIQDQYDDLITINELGAGNSRTFTDDNRHNTLINKMINKGTHGYDPKTGALIKLDTPLKGLSKEEEFMGTRAYAENVASGNKGFTSKKQDAQIKKLPKEQQEKINAANYNLRKNLVGEQNEKMVQNPLYYAPGVIAATAFGAPALAAAGEATFAGAGPSVAAAWNTSIPGLTALGEGATIGNAINAGFATHGAMNIGPDVQDFVEDPSWEGAGKIGMDALEITPVVGPAFRTGVEGYTAAKNVGKILTEETALKNAYKLNPLAFKASKDKIYRQVGKEGYDNAIKESKVFAKGQKEFLENNPGFDYAKERAAHLNKKGFNLEKPSIAPFFKKDELFFPKTFKKGKGKTKDSEIDYLFEGKVSGDESLLPRYRDKYDKVFNESGIGVLKPEYNNLSNFNLYKKNWLQGYKKIKPTSKELAATKKIQEQLRKRTTYPTQNSPSPLLPENAPYLSKVINKTPKDEQIFRSFLDARKRLKLEEGDIKHFDPQGNPIINKSGVDGNFLTRPLTPFDKNELTLGKQLYRKIGNKKGLKDLIDKGGAQAPAPMRMNSGATVDTPFFGGGKKPNENYGGLFAVETSMPSKSKYAWSSNVGGTRNHGVAPFDKATGSPVKNIPLDDLEVFRKKWFSNSYKKLDKENLQKELKSANLQEFSEKLYKYGIRGYLADQILNDGDLTGGKAVKLIEENFKNNKETKGDKELLKKQIKKQNGGIVSRKVLYNKVNSKKIKKRKR
tara:strand:+ start:1792 stop:4902 length:3111 start_codon:yes stop_codon:yes gene_type:complete